MTNARAFAGYLFDLDGTLVDTAPDLHAALNHALVHHGYATVSEALTRHWIGHGARAMISEALAAELGQAPTTELLDTLQATFLPYYEAHPADASQPYPEVVSTLEMLRARGAKLAVLTNKITRYTTRVLDALELTGHFDAVICGDTAAQPKPAADPALHACEVLGLTVEDVLIVGDSTTDVRCARAAGCAVVCVPYGYNQGVDPAALGADAVIESFSDLV